MIREPLIFAKEALKNKEDVIRQIAGAAKEEGVLRDPEDFMEAVLQREEEVSTSIGYGIAIPHGKTDAVKEPFISFMSFKTPFIWDQETGDAVKAAFLIGVPETNTEMLHLKAIAAISKRLLDDDFREELYACRSPREAYALLSEIDQSIR
mgnify:FL=1